MPPSLAEPGSQPAFAPPQGAHPPSFAPRQAAGPPPPPGRGAPPAPGYGGPPPGYGGPVPPGGWQQPLNAPAVQIPPDQLASWGSRAGAVALDFVFIWLPIAIAIGIIAGAASASPAAGIVVGVVLGLGAVAYWLLARPLLMARDGDRNGQTWGKQILGIRVIKDRGEPFDIGQAMLRQVAVKWLLIYMVGGSFLIPWLLNYLWPLWDDQDRTLHDMVVTSHVVKAD